MDISFRGDSGVELTRADFEGGHLTQESWDKFYGKLYELRKQAGHGRTFLASPTGGFVDPKAKQSKWTHALMLLPDIVALMGENPALAGGGYDIPASVAQIGALARELFDAEAEYAFNGDERYRTYFQEGAPEKLRAMLHSVAFKEGEDWKAANKAELAHSMWGKATAPTAGEDARWGALADVATRISLEDARALFGR